MLDRSFFIYKRNAFTNQMVPVGKGKELDGITEISIFYPQNKSFNSCSFLNLYTPEFYKYEGDRDVINYSEYYYFDEDYKELTLIKYLDGWISQIEFDKYVIGYILGTGINPYNAMIWLYDQFLDKEMFDKQSQEAKNAASVKTVYANKFEKLYKES
jgi:hypothetical protein